MTNDEIIVLAKECGVIEIPASEYLFAFSKSELFYFANSIANGQRELDAEYVRSFGYGIDGDMFGKLADAKERKEFILSLVTVTICLGFVIGYASCIFVNHQ
jgi:hypothetical protein